MTYDLPDFTPIEKEIHWGMPHGDPLYIIFAAVVMLIFYTALFYFGWRFLRWLSADP